MESESLPASPKISRLLENHWWPWAHQSWRTLHGNNLGVDVPAGISPMRWDDFIGQQANQDYQADELIEG